MKVHEDKFFKNIETEVCVLLNMKSILAKMKTKKTFQIIRDTFKQVLKVNLKSLFMEQLNAVDMTNFSSNEQNKFKFKLNSGTFVFKENLKFISMYISNFSNIFSLYLFKLTKS
jgi:hypothetical protein